jgi:hypothetical protein
VADIGRRCASSGCGGAHGLRRTLILNEQKSPHIAGFSVRFQRKNR